MTTSHLPRERTMSCCAVCKRNLVNQKKIFGRRSRAYRFGSAINDLNFSVRLYRIKICKSIKPPLSSSVVVARNRDIAHRRRATPPQRWARNQQCRLARWIPAGQSMSPTGTIVVAGAPPKSCEDGPCNIAPFSPSRP